MEGKVIIAHKPNMFYICVFLKTEDCKQEFPHTHSHLIFLFLYSILYSGKYNKDTP
jgi:hypothetical protein